MGVGRRCRQVESAESKKNNFIVRNLLQNISITARDPPYTSRKKKQLHIRSEDHCHRDVSIYLSWLEVIFHRKRKKTQETKQKKTPKKKKTNYEMLDKSISFANKTWAINLSVVFKFWNHFNRPCPPPHS